MKSYLDLSPALNCTIVKADQAPNVHSTRTKGLNCTFGYHFDLLFPGGISVVSRLMQLYDLRDGEVSANDYMTLLSLARTGIRANDNGQFAVSRLYLAKLYKELYRILRQS